MDERIEEDVVDPAAGELEFVEGEGAGLEDPGLNDAGVDESEDAHAMPKRTLKPAVAARRTRAVELEDPLRSGESDRTRGVDRAGGEHDAALLHEHASSDQLADLGRVGVIEIGR